MMQKSGTVSQVSGGGTWESSKGQTMYKFEVIMEDGTTGEYSSSKYQNINEDGFPFKLGSQVDYIFEDGKYPKIKQVPKDQGFKAGRSNFDNDAILYQNHYTGLMNHYTAVGWPESFGSTERERIASFSQTLLYLCKLSKDNILELKKH